MNDNITKRNGRRATVLVTDSGRGSAIAIIRSLGRQGYKVIAADSDTNSLGFHSRFVHERVVYPDPIKNPQDFCDYIFHIVKSKKVDLVIPITDLEIQPLAAAQKDFDKRTRLAIPDHNLLQAVTDKSQTVCLAKQLGVPVPQTCVVNTVKEALYQGDQLGWPLVVKPQSSRKMTTGEGIESFQVTYAGDAKHLKETMMRLEGRCSVLLQRYCQGTGYGVELLMNAGEPLAAFQHKRLREVPVTGGASAYRESVRLDPKLYDYSVRILKQLRWTGLAMVEFKDGDDGPSLMEINGRVWGSLPLAVVSGVDFPALLARLYLEGADGITPQINNEYKIGVRCRDIQKDLIWITSVLMNRQKYSFLPMPARMRAIKALLGFFNPLRKYDLLSFSDPWPGLAEFPRIISKFRSKMDTNE